MVIMDSMMKFLKIVYDYKNSHKRGPTFSEVVEEGKKYNLSETKAHAACDKLVDLCLIDYPKYVKEGRTWKPIIKLTPEVEYIVT